MGQKLAASVILGTFNRADLLRRALQSLVEQSAGAGAFEVIIIDDGSDDSTQDVLKEFTLKHSNIKSCRSEENLGLSAARKLGLAAASGDCILFTDDDCIVCENWVEKMCSCLAEHPIVSGAIRSPKRSGVLFSHNITHFHPFMRRRKSGPIDFISGANMGFQRKVLEELQGFDASRPLASDTHMCLKARSAGYDPYFASEAVVVHDPDYISLRGAVRSAYTHAATTILLRHEFSSLLDTPFFLKSPFLLRLFSPVIALGVTSRIYLRNPRLWIYFWTVPLVLLLKLTWCWGAAAGLKGTNKFNWDCPN